MAAANGVAALMYLEPGPERIFALDLEAAALEARLSETGARPVAITVDDEPPRRFSVALENAPAPQSSVHIDLDEAGVRALLDDSHGIADFATYVTAGVRRYAVIVEAARMRRG